MLIYNAETHGISVKKSFRGRTYFCEFNKVIISFIVGHITSFDITIMGAEFYRLRKTIIVATDFCAIPGR